LPFGAVAPEALHFLDELLPATLGAATLHLPPVALPEQALSAPRAQYDADVLLDELYARAPDRCLRILGVAEVDLYVTGRTFVFGYAHLSDGMAVFSLARLRESFYGRAPQLAPLHLRIGRAVLHEMGHTFGNPHCEESCVMHAVTQIETLDALPPGFCRSCQLRVEAGLRIEPWSALGRWQRGMAHLRRREFARAVEALEHAVRSAPREPRYLHDLGAARLALGDRAGARAALRRAVELGGPATASPLGWALAAAEGGDSDDHP
jgi:archaemetzincin